MTQEQPSPAVEEEPFRVPVLDLLRLAVPAVVVGVVSALTLLGRVSCKFPRIELQGGLPRRVEGTATWRDLAVAGAATAALPGLEIAFRTESEGLIAADVKDLGGPLAIDGQVRVAGDRFRTEVRLNLREPNPALEEVLKTGTSFGAPTEREVELADDEPVVADLLALPDLVESVVTHPGEHPAIGDLIPRAQRDGSEHLGFKALSPLLLERGGVDAPSNGE